MREGSATFWRRSRYRLAAHSGIALKELFPSGPGQPAKYASTFEPMLRSSPALAHALPRIATVAQLSLLLPTGAVVTYSGAMRQEAGGVQQQEQPGNSMYCSTEDGGDSVNGSSSSNTTAAPTSTPTASSSADQPLLLVNTHLFFHYMAPHIRTMHTWAIMQEAAAFLQEAVAPGSQIAAALGGRRPALVFCGDLNSDLNDGIPGAIELLQKGRLAGEFWDWAFGLPFSWNKGEEGEGEGKGGQTEAEGEAARVAPPAAAAAQGTDEDGTGEFGEVSKMVHGSVEHMHAASSAGSPRSSQQRPPAVPGAAVGEESGLGGGAEAEAEAAGAPTDAVVAGVDLEIPFRLRPADGLRSELTNYVKGYQGLLDYIW